MRQQQMGLLSIFTFLAVSQSKPLANQARTTGPCPTHALLRVSSVSAMGARNLM